MPGASPSPPSSFPSFSSTVPKVPVNSRGSKMLPAAHLSAPPYTDVCLSIQKFAVCGCTCVIDLSAHERRTGKTQTNSGPRKPHLAAAVPPACPALSLMASRCHTERGSLAGITGLLAGGVGLPCQTHTSAREAGPRAQINTRKCLKQTHSHRHTHSCWHASIF